MAFDDLRQFIEILESEGELLRVPEEVDAQYEIGAWCRVVADAGGPALLFENVKGHDIPVLVNAFGTRKRVALALGLEPREMVKGCLSLLENRIAPRMASSSEAICQQVVLTGDEVDMAKLPIPLWSVGDGGPYITAAVHLGRHPQLGKNASINRMQLKGPRQMAVCMAPDHFLRLALEDAKRQGAEGIEVAVAIGLDPTIYFAASSDFPIGDYEIAVAGALRGEPVPMVECKTIDAEVPAHAEIVLEGIFTGKTDSEGPFVEYTGHQTPAIQSPIFEIKAITHRRDPILQCIHLSKSPCEANNLWRELEDIAALREMRARFPMLKALTRPPAVARDFMAVFQIDPTRSKPGVVQNMLLGAIMLMGRVKFFVAVDDDVDIFNLTDVLWAINTRVDPARDVTILPRTMTSHLDPAVATVGLGSKLLIDATKKPDFRGKVSAPPAEMVQAAREKLGKYWRAT